MTEARGVDAGRGGGSGDGEPVDTSHHSDVDWIAAEDTRHTRRLLAHFGIATPLVSVHEHN